MERLFLVAMCMAAAACAPVPQRKDPPRPVQVVFPAPPDAPRFVYEWTLYSSADVVKDDRDLQLRRMITGESRTGTGLAKPYAVAVHKGRIFLSDSVERFVKVFDVPEGRYFQIGLEGAGRLAKPLGIDVDRSGSLYVADASLRSVMVYDRDGKFLRKIGNEKMFDRISSVTVDPGAERVYVVDIGGVDSENHRVRVFEGASGRHLFDIGKRGKGPGEFNLPRDLAVGRDGHLYVVDSGNFRIQVFDPAGRYLHAFGNIGKQLGNFARPKEVATDRDGNVYVVDTAFGNFQLFTPEGDLLMFIGERSEQDGPARYMLPSGVYVDEDGRIYVVDQWFRKVDIFRPAGLGASEGWLGRRAGAARPAAAR
ncbi:MAG: 6-bladed beta-propeller [Burkholderiales bacterium]